MDSAIQNMGDNAVLQSSAVKLNKRLPANGNIDKTSKDFESMFMSQMLQPMFEGVGVDPTFGGGHGEQIMRTFLVQEYGKIASKGSHLGIADAVKSEMIKAQAVGQTNSSGGQNAVAQ